MIRAEVLLAELAARGHDVVSGVPCSYLTPLINSVINAEGLLYVGAANEGDAVSIACGADLAGRKGLAMFQNSGLGNAVNPLTSLTEPFRLPLLVVTTWRGEPDRPKDEPQHTVMGRITPGLLELMDMPWERFPDEEADLGPALDRAVDFMTRERMPYGFIMSKGTVEGDKSPAVVGPQPPVDLSVLPAAAGAVAVHDQDAALDVIQGAVDSRAAVVATTGFTGRALYARDDRPNQLYMVGSMGCAVSLGLGVALVQPERKVVVLDGDGAVLMRMGALAVVGQQRAENLVHVVLDNGVHDSTGGQATVSPFVDLPAVAAACGYRRVVRVDGLDELGDALRDAAPGPTFVHVRTHPRQDRKLPRPTLTPAEVADRFRAHLATPA